MERKKVVLNLKTATKNRKSKDVPLDGITPQANSHKKGILKDTASNNTDLSGHGSPLSRSGSYLGTLEKSHDQNESLGFHCSFETDGSSEQDVDVPCTQPVSYDKILEGVVAFIEVRSNTENRFEGISKQMEMLGATVVKKLTPEVTHVIFKDGKKTTRERALKKGMHLVSVLWVESCRQSGKRVSEDLFPVMVPGEAVTPLMVGRLKRTKSMQPKAFEEDVQNSADRGDRRRKRKLQAENVTPTAMIFCAETQDLNSPIVLNPPLTPHMVPDTPCHRLDASPPNKTPNNDKVTPQEKPKLSEEETDQSPDSSDDIPSSIRKLKRRLVKSTPTRPPSTALTEPRTTPAAKPRKTPKDVLLTGSEHGKKRKRQDSAKESQCEDAVKESAGVKQKKKVKLGGQADCDASDKEAYMYTENGERNAPAARKDGKDSPTRLNSMETSDENIDDKKTQAIIPEKKKTPAKTKKKFSQGNTSEQNEEDLESDSGVSTSDGNAKVPVPNSAAARKKKFSKTSKLIGQVGKADEFGELAVAGEPEGKQVENKNKTKLGATTKQKSKQIEVGDGDKLVNRDRTVNQEKQVSQGKPVSREKPVSQVNGCEGDGEMPSDNDEEKTVKKSGVGKANGRQRKAVKGVSLTRNEEDEDDETETYTEEEEQQSEEKENRAVKKKQTKLVKKVKPKRSVVMTSMHFTEQDIILSVVRKLGGFFIEDRVSPSTSHVIAGSPRRTLNVLMAIAQGCWLVSPMWMMKSLEVGYWVDEEPYELSDAFPAAQLCRLERVSAGPSYRQDLFVECPPIFVSENCSPPSDSLMSLISLCGGKVSTSVRKAGICIGSMTRRTQAINITEQWLLDCITQHAVLPYTHYALNSPAKRRRETSPSY